MYSPPKPAYLDFEDLPLYFDVVEKESLKHTATATEHPVEEGSNVSDHVRDNLDVVTLEVFISNTPITDVNQLYNGQVAGLELDVPRYDKPIAVMPGAAINAGLDAIASAISGPQQWKAMVLQFPEKFNNVGFIFNTLIDWKQRGVLGKVITPHRTYESVVITNVEMSRDAASGAGGAISLEFKEIRLVEAKLITAPIPTEDRGKIMKSKGRQPVSFTRNPGPKKSLLTKGLGR